MTTLLPAMLYIVTSITLLCMVVYAIGFLKGMEHNINESIKQVHDDMSS